MTTQYKIHAADGLAAVIAGNRSTVRNSRPIGRPDCKSTRFTDQQCTTDPDQVTCTKCAAKIARARETAGAATAYFDQATQRRLSELTGETIGRVEGLAEVVAEAAAGDHRVAAIMADLAAARVKLTAALEKIDAIDA